MSGEFGLLLQLAVAVVVALLGGLLAHRLRQSVIVGYLLAGVAIGPFTPGFVGDRQQIAGLAEIGVIFLLFALGIELSLKELRRVRGVAIVGTAIQVALTIAAGAGLGYLAGWSIAVGFFFGGIIAISSTMVILKMLLDRGEVGAPHGRVLLGMLLVQDLVAVLLMVLLPRLAGEGGSGLASFGWTALMAAAFVGTTLILGARVVPAVMHRVERLGSPDLFLLTAAALALGTATISALLGLSPALGAFMAGLMLSETGFEHRVIAEMVPMRNLFATLFFVSVGMLIDPSFFLSHAFDVLGMAVFIIATKVLATGVAILPFRLGARTVSFTVLGMIPIGEFSFVLAQAGRETGLISDTLANLILTSSILSIVLTPVAFAVTPAAQRLLRRLPRLAAGLGGAARTDAPEPGLTDHAIVIGGGRVGGRVVAGLSGVGLRTVVIDEDLDTVRRLRADGADAFYGDASNPGILAVARPAQARLIVVALPGATATRAVVRELRRANSDAPILVRAANDEEVGELQQAGATTIVAPEAAGAMILLEHCARELEIEWPAMSEAQP